MISSLPVLIVIAAELAAHPVATRTAMPIECRNPDYTIGRRIKLMSARPKHLFQARPCQNNSTVIAADIVDRGYPGCLVQDFLDRKSAPPTVVGNPPFNAVEAFARHALELGARKVALLFPVARLNAARWLKELPLRRIWLLTPRPSMPPGYVIAQGETPGGGKTDFAWLIFEPGYTGKAEIHWLHRDGGI